MSMKNFSDNIGNRTRDLPACSAVAQPTAPPRAPETTVRTRKFIFRSYLPILLLLLLLLIIIIIIGDYKRIQTLAGRETFCQSMWSNIAPPEVSRSAGLDLTAVG